MRSLLLVLFLSTSTLFAKSPLIYLTWYDEPSKSMAIQWITDSKDNNDELFYTKAAKSKSHSSSSSKSSWTKAIGTHAYLPEKHPHSLHKVMLRNLEIDTIYEFRIGDSSKTYRFRTMPENLKTPIRFIVGGDVYCADIKRVQRMNHQAAKVNPRFAILGGDIAYSAPSGKKKKSPDDFSKWREFFSVWMDEMKDADGCMIPLFTTIGNHEVKGRYNKTSANAPLYYTFFPRPFTKTYYDFGFGWYAHFVFLDSSHTTPIKGKQTKWLEKILKKHAWYAHRFAIYHVGAYPSTGDFDIKVRRNVRKYWVPLFEKYRLNGCFENHDHSYKRTHPLINGKINPKGVVYFGDGSWGVEPRKPKKRSYIAHAVQAQQVLVVELSEHKRTFKALDADGKTIDTYEQEIHK